MRSTKPSARPFQEWVTGELLPSIRRGDTEVPKQQQRMAESLSEAVGQRVQILAEIDHLDGAGIHIRSDGEVHCRHGRMVLHTPEPEQDSGPPFGQYYECTSVERVGIRGGRAIRRCARLKVVDMVRHLANAPKPRPGPYAGPLVCEFGRARIYGEAPDIVDLLREAGEL
ncbi:hypothetical protein [Kitasatospora sp. NPDC088346]|uniref:hypothetical protein n=1 Tax=Kitasatospora sp. NPDC088346 TaxID=3364073 RepID=UPI0038102000